MLLPAAVLAMLVLAAIAVDLSIAFLGQRELANASVAAANDAATVALSDRAYYEGGEVAVDPGRLESLAEAQVRAALDPERFSGVAVEAHARPPASGGCAWTVVVRVAAEIDYLFAPAIPGGPQRASVRASATASPRQDGGPC